jgi:predicted dehydrogenase
VAALEAGAHVLCEKPVARTGEEATRMVAAAEKMDRVFQVAFNYRYRSDVRILKRHVDQGALGHVYYAKARWLRRSGIPSGTGWFTTRELAGGGPLMDLGVHMLDMALYLMGEPEVASVTAATYAELGPRRHADPPPSGESAPVFDVEDIAAAFMRLSGGETLTLEASWAGYSGLDDRFGVTLFGAEGGAEIDVQDYGQADTLRLYTDVAGAPAEVRPRLGPSGGHRAVVADFVAAVRGDDWPSHRGRDALARALIIDACYRSAKEGHEVPVAVRR